MTLTYLVDVHNNFAANDEVNHLSFTITIDGTNDVPTLAATSAAVAEHSGATDHAGGTITFTDVDLTDRPVVTTAFSTFTYKDAHGNDVTSALTPAQQAEVAAVEAALTLNASLTNANNGTVTWSYDIADGKLGFLADGDLLTLTYMASVDDGHGGQVSTPITVTILGVSDVPFPISEQSNESQPNPTGSNAPDTVSGTLAFTGVDLGNVQSVDNTLISVTWSGGSALPSGLVSTLASSLTESVTQHGRFQVQRGGQNLRLPGRRRDACHHLRRHGYRQPRGQHDQTRDDHRYRHQRYACHHQRDAGRRDHRTVQQPAAEPDRFDPL